MPETPAPPTPAPRPRHFTADYVEHARLRDGTPVLLRLIRPDDKPLIRAGFERFSPESRYARFFAPKQTLSDDELRYLTEIDQEHHFAIGAMRDDGDDRGEPVGLGIARFIRLADPPNMAEAAISVTDDVHGKGLGKLLLLRLCAAAEERGISEFRCEVLGSNTSMTHLIEKVSPERRIEVGDGVMCVELAVPHVAPDEPVTSPAAHGVIYELFRAAASNAIEWTEAVKRLWGRR